MLPEEQQQGFSASGGGDTRSKTSATILRLVRGRISSLLAVRRWNKQGRPVPPPDVIKQKTVRRTARMFQAPVLVETGTYLGDMVEASRREFKRVFSIELDHELARLAARRFQNYAHISIIEGDSGTALPEALKRIEGRCLFWLDGHYSGGITAKGTVETPVLDELRHIKSFCREPVILIDDARLFRGSDDYPALEELERFVRNLWPEYIFEVADDIIRILPSQRGQE